MQDKSNATDYRAIAMAWVTELDHRPAVESIAKHLHANESLHLHDCTEGPEPCSYCWLRAAKAVQAIERDGCFIAAPPPERMLVSSEVAALFSVDPKTVARWADIGKIPSVRTPGGHRRYRESEVRALLDGTR